ncbi:MAG: hypothetical protein H7255_05910 [Ramlibacter sp.]|nr:hypothetical protein [Ramlibacter sp.]
MNITSIGVSTPSITDPAVALGANDAIEDIVEELSSIRPSHRSRKSQVADFLFRRKTSDMPEGAMGAAKRVHQSKFFNEALARHAKDSQHGGGGSGRGSEAMAALLEAVKPRKGSAGASFDPAKQFAAQRKGVVAPLLASGGEAFTQNLHAALVRSGMGGTKARKCTEVIYAALVAQFATQSESTRLGHYESKLAAIESGSESMANRLKALNAVDAELAGETELSSAGMAHLKIRLDELRPMLEQTAAQQDSYIEAAMDGITTTSSPQEIDGRLRELDERALSVENSVNLDDATRVRLQGLIASSRTLLDTLKTREADLDALAGQPRLQQALRSLDAHAYVPARQGLTHVLDKVASDYRPALLERLDEMIQGPREAQWLVAMREGDAGIIDMILSGAQWDDQAWSVKLGVLDPATGVALLNLEAQHQCRKAARELDHVMQSAALRSRANKFPVNAFGALKADAALIGWFVQNAPKMVDQRDLAIASWIRLSLHDAATGQPDTAKCDALFLQLQAKGIDTAEIEIYARQGFNSSSDVRACMRQIQAFSQALQKSTQVGSLDPQARVEQIGASAASRVRAMFRMPVIAKPSTSGASQAKAAAALEERRVANERIIKAAVASLLPNQAITISLLASGGIEVSVPTIPGLSVATALSVEAHTSIRISRATDEKFELEILKGLSVREGVSVKGALDVLDVSFGITQERDNGRLIRYDQQVKCEGFVVALANGADLEPHLKAASSVDAVSISALRGDVSVSATADFTIASISAEVAASAGERRSVYESGQFKREVFSRDARADVVLKAEVAGGLASAQAGTGIDMGVRRALVRENGMLAGGPQRRELNPTLSLVARVAFGDDSKPSVKAQRTQRCIDGLLPGITAQQKQAIVAQLGEPQDGTEFFTRYQLNEAARVEANVLLGKANALLTQAAQQPGASQKALRGQASDFVKRADAVTRNPANYQAEGFGWTLRSSMTSERSPGISAKSAERSSEQTSFIAFDAMPDKPQVGQSMLLAMMA